MPIYDCGAPECLECIREFRGGLKSAGGIAGVIVERSEVERLRERAMSRNFGLRASLKDASDG